MVCLRIRGIREFYAISFEFTIWKVRVTANDIQDIKQWEKRRRNFTMTWKLFEFQGIVRNMENIRISALKTFRDDGFCVSVFRNFLLPFQNNIFFYI